MSLSVPYHVLVEPAVPWLRVALYVFALACLGLAWTTRTERRVPLTILLLSSLLLLLGRAEFAVWSAAAFGLILTAHAIALYGLARYDWPSAATDRLLPLWTGLLIVAAAFVCKCIALDDYPRILNSYSAWTGLDGLHALEGQWPRHFFQGKEYDLMNGGHSPLQLPLLWVCMRLFGGTKYAVRFAEVIGSTVLLTLVWLWLRHAVRGAWGLLALAVFAFSPWHLAQSRSGTFLSISTSVAFLLLWVATQLERPRAASGWWVLFGIGAGLIGYAYAPVKVCYAFFFIVVAVCAGAAWRNREPLWWRGPLLALATFFAFLILQLWNPERFGEMFRSDFGVLATDTSIWHKTVADEVTNDTQPPRVIAENFFRNAHEWVRLAYSEPVILPWYAPACSVAVLAAIIGLFRSRQWIAPIYFLIGMLPPLIIFPLMRRTLVIWPLIYVFAVVFLRELVRHTTRILPSPLWRACCIAVPLVALVTASVHGLHLFASTNSLVRTGTYFGGDHVWRLTRDVKAMLPTHQVYFVNLDNQIMPIVEIELFEHARTIGRRYAWHYLRVRDEDTDLGHLVEGEPLAFVHLVENEHMDDAILDKVEKLLSGGQRTRYLDDDGSGVLLYSIYRHDGVRN